MTKSPDLDHTHNRLVAALKGIVDGKKLDDRVLVPLFGTQTIVGNALSDACRLQEPFHNEHLALVNAAFGKLGIDRPSEQKDQCAAALLAAMIKRKVHLA